MAMKALSREEAKDEIKKELDGYIEKFNKYKKDAGWSEQWYDAAMKIKNEKIPMLQAFAEKYLDIVIKIDASRGGSQYNPGTIDGYTIE